jgi:hypothetical protein
MKSAKLLYMEYVEYVYVWVLDTTKVQGVVKTNYTVIFLYHYDHTVKTLLQQPKW